MPRTGCYSGWFEPKNPSKYIGDAKKIRYRSLWERDCMRMLDANPNVLKWSSEELTIKYFDEGQKRVRTYFPDFVVKLKKPDNVIEIQVWEVKPAKETKPPRKKSRKTARKLTRKQQQNLLEEHMTWKTNQSKWQQAKQFCDSNGWKFHIITEKIIYGKGKK